jgi:hypothetical protein
MGKNKQEVEEVVAVDKKAVKDAKKAQKKDVRDQLKALHLSHEPPAYVDAHDCDGFLLACGLPVSKLAHLDVSFNTRVVVRADLFSKTKAAHRCVAAACEAAARDGRAREAAGTGRVTRTCTRAKAAHCARQRCATPRRAGRTTRNARRARCSLGRGARGAARRVGRDPELYFFTNPQLRSFLHDEPTVSWTTEGEHTLVMVRTRDAPRRAGHAVER